MRFTYPLKWLKQDLGIAKLRTADVLQKGSDKVLAERVAHLLDSFIYMKLLHWDVRLGDKGRS